LGFSQEIKNSILFICVHPVHLRLNTSSISDSDRNVDALVGAFVRWQSPESGDDTAFECALEWLVFEDWGTTKAREMKRNFESLGNLGVGMRVQAAAVHGRAR